MVERKRELARTKIAEEIAVKAHERKPREMIARLSNYLAEQLAPLYSKMFVDGSFVRGLPTCGDLDLAFCCTEVEWKFISDLGMTIRKGKQIVTGFYPWEDTVVQIDMWRFLPACWGVGCMFVAGNGQLNIIQRAKAKRQGYNIGFSLTNLETGVLIPAFTEREVYDLLGWPWLPYSERNIT